MATLLENEGVRHLPHATLEGTFGLPVISLDLDQSTARLIKVARETVGRPALVMHVNLHNYFHLVCDDALRSADLCDATLLLEGVGMKLGAWLGGCGWRTDVNGTDLVPRALELAQEDTLPVYFLGASPSVVERAVEKAQQGFRGLKVVGSHPGYFSPSEEEGIVAQINASGARILLVGRGFPLEAQFSVRHRDHLRVGLIWNVGGLFDFLSGEKRRAPVLLRRMRLEWLFRFAYEPRRMWFRNVVIPPWFLGRLLSQLLGRSLGRSLGRLLGRPMNDTKVHK